MKLCDINVFVYAHRKDSISEHPAYADYVVRMATGREAFGISESVLSGFVRSVTNPRIFKEPTPLEQALQFCDNLLDRPNACVLRPSSRNWPIFEELCQAVPAKGKLVADAWHAALAIEYDCDWISTDSDFARFPGLRWSHPLVD